MINFNSKISQIVLGYFLLNIDSEMYLNEMAKKFNVDRANLSRKLTEWVKEGILLKAKTGNLSLYRVNKKYSMLPEIRRIAQKSFGLESMLRENLKKIKGIESAYIFGSYANNKMNGESDIDLLLIGSHKALDAQKSVLKIQKSIDREINIIDMMQEEVKQKRKDDLLKNIFKNKNIKLI